MILITAALMLAGADQVALRHSFAQCLNKASTQAKVDKIGPDAFVEFAKTNCADAAAPFQAALADTNVSHGMSRKAAINDAAAQVNDYYKERLENYKFEMEPQAAAAPK